MSEMNELKWTSGAEKLMGKIPFFVRKRVRKKVEEAARRQGVSTVTESFVALLQKRFMNAMEEEVKGFSIETCFGPSGCPNRAIQEDRVAAEVEKVLDSKDLKAFLKKKVEGPLKLHHEFRVAVADCPNCCSRPQICDVGLVGASKPKITDEPCRRCNACVEACPDGAVHLDDSMEAPQIDFDLCLACGKCIRVCPTGTIAEAEKGYRLLVGGKLGRHPHLADELPGIHSLNEVLAMVDRCVSFYMAHLKKGERFGEVIEKEGLDALEREIQVEKSSRT